MPKIDLSKAPRGAGSRYPKPFDEPCRARRWLKLGEAAGLTQFGVNLVTLPPGCWSSQRHWHTHEDEFVQVISGEVVLATDAGEEPLRAGDCAAFKAGDGNGHQVQNRSEREAVLLVVGSRSDDDRVEYPDVDLAAGPGNRSGPLVFRHKDGRAY
jgi:uncharacterized cupin superfamily protein